VDAENHFWKYINLRSVLNKKDDVGILMNCDNLDIFRITESWTHSGSNDEELYVTNFNMFRIDRIIKEKKKGG